ncbi:HlyD family secretion protein [Gluconacetobacter sacchari]|uniref:HlyD family secretion protein n=1 Tax=Gluconacetobacter sacchari TaxID=92759 RepID=UPI0039B39BB9
MNAPAPPAPGASPPPPPPTRKAKWPWITGGVVLGLCAGVVVLDLYLPHAHVKTDDAYVTAHYAVIAPRVSGQVIDVAIDDNQVVKKGQLLVALDPADYETAIAQAETSLSEDLAQVSQAQVQVERQPALILQADAQVRAADAALTLARANDTRYAALSRIGAGSTQQQQEHSTTLRQQEVALQAAQASLSGCAGMASVSPASTCSATGWCCWRRQMRPTGAGRRTRHATSTEFQYPGMSWDAM